MVEVLLTAWVFTWFELDKILIKGLNELLNKNYTTSVYWVIAFVIGAVVSLLRIVF